MPRKKVSKNVTEQLENAVQEALQQLDDNPFGSDEETITEGIMNDSAEYEQETEPKPKRKRRTKAEMAMDSTNEKKAEPLVFKCNGTSHITATVEWDQDKDDTTEIPTLVEIPDSILVNDYNIETVSNYLSDAVGYCHKGFSLSWPDSHETQEEFCQWEIEKAHLENKPEPDFDYRLFYQKGDKVYLVRYYDSLNTKEIIYMTLRTVYPRMLIGVVDKQYCQCAGISDRDNIFYNRQDAMDYFNSIQADVADEYNEETGKKKRKHKKQEENVDDETEIEDTEEDEDEE